MGLLGSAVCDNHILKYGGKTGGVGVTSEDAVERDTSRSLNNKS